MWPIPDVCKRRATPALRWSAFLDVVTETVMIATIGFGAGTDEESCFVDCLHRKQRSEDTSFFWTAKLEV
jgi:hypothetical protein